MTVSICTTTARRGFVEHQAAMIARQILPENMPHALEWVLVDFAYEERREQLAEVAQALSLEIKHVPNVRDSQFLMRDIARNRNEALRHATGDYIIFLDDYAIIPQDFVAEHLRCMKAGNNLSAGNMYRLEHVIPDLQPLVSTPFSDLLEQYKDTLGIDGRSIRNGIKLTQPYRAAGISYTGNLGIPRHIFEYLNGFDPRMDSGLEDSDFGLRAYMAGFDCYFNPHAQTINVYTGHIPYTFAFDHVHDVEPFISNHVNNYRGDATLKNNGLITVEFHNNYRTAVCKICGARGMIDPTELLRYKQEKQEFRIPDGLPGGLDTLRKA